MKDKKAVKFENILNMVLISLIIFVGILIAFVNLMRYKAGLNADIAAEGLLAREIWESKQWIPDEWYFSSEAKVISVANLAALFYGMTQNVCISMGIACIIGSIFIGGSLWYLSGQLSFTITQRVVMLLLALILPNNRIMAELMYIHAGYYAIHMGLYFLTLALYVKLLKRDKIKNVEIIINLLLHFVLGMQGVRGILMITGPLLAIEVVRHIYLWWSKQKEKREDIITICFVVMTNMMGYFGGKIPLSIKYPLSRNIRKAPQKFAEKVLPDFFNAFAWGSISIVEKIIYIICLGLIVYLVTDIVVKGIKRKEIKEDSWIVMNFVASVVLTVAALVFTTVDSSNRYFLVIYFAIAMGITILIGSNNKIIKSGLIFMISILFVVNCYKMYYPLITDRSYEQHIYGQVGEYLIQEGYDYAYADFINANTITVFNDGKIQVSAVNSFEDMSVCKWLTSKNWYVPNVSKESRTAYIVPDKRMYEMDEFLREHKDDVEFKIKISDLNIYGSDYNYSKLTD